MIVQVILSGVAGTRLWPVGSKPGAAAPERKGRSAASALALAADVALNEAHVTVRTVRQARREAR
jgi:hypothetical protein